MKTQKIGAGTTLNFKVPLPISITNYQNIEVEIFVDESKPIKFSCVEKTGFQPLIQGDTDLEIIGKLKSSDSLKLKGCLFMKLNCFREIGVNENIGFSATFGIGEYTETTPNVFIQTSQLILV